MRLSNQTTGGPAMRRPAITGTGHANGTDAVPMHRYDGIVARERTYAPRSSLEEHVHEYAVLVLVLEGEFKERCRGREESRRPFALRIMPAGEPHSNVYGPLGARCLLTEIHSARLEAWNARARSLTQLAHYQPGSLPADIARSMHREFTVGDDVAMIAIEGLVCELITAVDRQLPDGWTGPAPAWLGRVRARLHEEFRAALTLAALAADAGVHPGHLQRVFRRHYGCTPAQYAAQLRIGWAQHALLRPDAAIASVALDAGFSDQAHFTRRFRRLTGTTPGKYRQAYLGQSTLGMIKPVL
jgi:AraC family transcriptional regulator